VTVAKAERPVASMPMRLIGSTVIHIAAADGRTAVCGSFTHRGRDLTVWTHQTPTCARCIRNANPPIGRCPVAHCGRHPDEHKVAGTQVSFADWHAWDRFTR
jgi:hypothetical protein